MEIIPLSFLNAVVAIGIATQDGSKYWIGTGFIVSRKENHNSAQSTYYIITNKHVVSNRSLFYIRFNSLGDSLVKDYPVQLLDERGNKLFSEHTNQKTDIIAFQIEPMTLISDKSIWGAFDLDDNAFTLDQMQKAGLNEGSLIYALGFPMNLVDDIKVPICRLGCISRVMDAFVLKSKFPVFLVDAQTFPGNSGGPIVSRPELISVNGVQSSSSAKLIGILSSYLPYIEKLYSRQTGRDRMTQEENSGLTVVHPVDRIKEVVELEWQRMERLKEKDNTIRFSVPEGAQEEVVV